VKTRLEQLNNEFNHLEELINRGKSLPVQVTMLLLLLFVTPFE
jgi:hypothetical protein